MSRLIHEKCADTHSARRNYTSEEIHLFRFCLIVLCFENSHLLAIERIMERIKMIEKTTKTICNVLVRLACHASVCFDCGLFLDFLPAIATHLSCVWKGRPSLLFQA